MGLFLGVPSAGWQELLSGGPVVLGVALAAGLAGWAAVRFWPAEPSWEEWVRRRSHRRDRESARRWGRPFPGLGWLAGRIPTRLGGGTAAPGAELATDAALARGLLWTAAAALPLLALALLGAVPPLAALLLIAAVPIALLLRVAGRRRRRVEAISAQLPILVDLMSLEQSGGGLSARAAMESVLSRVRGEAAELLRGCLAESATFGTAPLDLRIEQEALRVRLPELVSLAAVLRLQRDEGIASSVPLGHLARGLRDRQRDQLLARGRKALVLMLLPVALCILLPFVLILLYPALERLGTALS